MNKLHRDIPRMIDSLSTIEQYNNYRQLGAIEDIIFLKEKVNNLYNVKDAQELIKDFSWCAKMINMYLAEIEPEFKEFMLKEQKKRAEE